ncbi:hypothetical protein HDU83_005304 [Entophlyctis luteolus]|nr:hypothetical protein HDU83_005304 [Entophlyctis luteolus]
MPASTLRRVVVTGIGAVTPLADSAMATWRALLTGACGIVGLDDPEFAGLPSRVAGRVQHPDRLRELYVPKSDLSKTTPFMHYAYAAAHQALEDADWLPNSDSMKHRTGVCVGSGIGCVEEIAATALSFSEKGYRKVAPHFVPRTLVNMAAGNISIRYGFKGPNHSVSTACATGAHSIGDAMRFIQYGDADVMVAGGTEASVSPLSVAGFCRSKSLATAFNDSPAKSCRPFDMQRDGFVIAEGAAVVVLEEYEHAKSRGAKIYAELVGYGLTGDASHITAPPADGNGAARAMQRALEVARLRPNDIDYVNAHATSTPLGDVAETRAIRSVFGSRAVAVSSTKGATGHLLGAAGAVEAIFTILSVKENIVPFTLNLQDVGDDVENLNFVKDSPSIREVRAAMSNSFGVYLDYIPEFRLMSITEALPDFILGNEILTQLIVSEGLLRHARECRLVCRRWMQLLEKAFWRTLVVDVASFKNIIQQRMPDQGDDHGSSQGIADLQVDPDELWNAAQSSKAEFCKFLSNASNLKVLHCGRMLERVVPPIAIEHCRELVSLQIEFWNIYLDDYTHVHEKAAKTKGQSSDIFEENFIALFPNLQQFPNFQPPVSPVFNIPKLTCIHSDEYNQLFRIDAARIFNKLRFLRMHPLPMFSFSAETMAATFAELAASLDKLQPLELPICHLYVFGTPESIISVARHTPHVRSIEFHIVNGELSDLIDTISLLCPKIEYIRTAKVSSGCKIQLFKNLQHFRIDENKAENIWTIFTPCASLRTIIPGNWISLGMLEEIIQCTPWLENIGPLTFDENIYTQSAGVKFLVALATLLLRMPRLRWVRIKFTRDQTGVTEFVEPWTKFLEVLFEGRGRRLGLLVVQMNADLPDVVWRAAVDAGIDFYPPRRWIWPSAEFEILQLDGMTGSRCHYCTSDK